MRGAGREKPKGTGHGAQLPLVVAASNAELQPASRRELLGARLRAGVGCCCCCVCCCCSAARAQRAAREAEDALISVEDQAMLLHSVRSELITAKPRTCSCLRSHPDSSAEGWGHSLVDKQLAVVTQKGKSPGAQQLDA